ncbi:MAG: YitT family protein [Clostridia bacterium]|nr:YitT family protein [Clostridia bacterium]
MKKTILEITGTILGSFIMSIAVALFLLPNQLSSGGITGIATITYYLLKIPMGIMIVIINIPLFIIAIYKIGKNFFIKSMIGTISLSIFIDILDKIQPLTNDRFLACIYGGIIIGLRNSNNFKSKFFNRWNRPN